MQAEPIFRLRWILLVSLLLIAAACSDADGETAPTDTGDETSTTDGDDGSTTTPGNGGAPLGEATLDFAGDYEVSHSNGGAIFVHMEQSAVPPTDFELHITVAASIPVGMETDHLELRFNVENDGDLPEPGDYPVSTVATDTETVAAWAVIQGLPEDDLSPTQAGGTLSIESASSSAIVGSFDIPLETIDQEQDFEALVTGSFRAVPAS